MNRSIYSHSDKELIRILGIKLKEVRVEMGFSQMELSKKTGMSRSSISEIEKGRNFSITSFISIARALQILDKLEYFFTQEPYELSPMEIYQREKNKRQRGGYKK